MHILFITTYFEPDSGAAAVRLSRLARLLQKRGHQITVLTTMPHYPQGEIAESHRGKFTVVDDIDGIRVVRTWLYATPNKRISRRLLSQISFMITASIRGIGLKRPDVIFIEAQPVFTSLVGRFLSFIKRRPYVLNVSDLWPEYLVIVGIMKETHPIYRIFKGLVNFIERQASAIVSLHTPILESIEKRIGNKDTHYVIHNAVDLQAFHPNLNSEKFRQAHKLNNDEKLVMFIGTFGMHIDFDTMLAVAEQFNNREDVRFVFVGTGGQLDKVQERLAQLSLSQSRHIDWVEHTDMPYIWKTAHIAFWAIHEHPMYRATLQSKVYEAMATGTPVAIAIEGLTEDIITKSGAGITVSFGDTNALVDAIKRLLDDEDFHQQCALSARAYAEANFDPERVADAYEQVLLDATQI